MSQRDEQLERVLGQLMVRGRNDWLCIVDFINAARAGRPERDANAVFEFALEIARTALSRGLFVVGSVYGLNESLPIDHEASGPFFPWRLDVDDAVGLIRELERNRGTGGSLLGAWFQLTDHGAAVARTLESNEKTR